jgi:hypothetical protein
MEELAFGKKSIKEEMDNKKYEIMKRIQKNLTLGAFDDEDKVTGLRSTKPSNPSPSPARGSPEGTISV